MKTLHLVPIGALLIALLEMPYGYYQLLRVGICLVAVFLAYQAFEGQRSRIAWIFAAAALTYNPIAPLALGRGLWTIVNLATVGLLIWSLMDQRRKKVLQNEAPN